MNIKQNARAAAAEFRFYKYNLKYEAAAASVNITTLVRSVMFVLL